MDIDSKYPLVSDAQAVREKNWAAGSAKPVDSEELIIPSPPANRRAEIQQILYPPALLKAFDEVLVNALDQFVRTSHESGAFRTTEVDINVSNSGEIHIRNNGRGIEIAIHNAASKKAGRVIYLPTFLLGFLHQGTNHVKSADNIIGGTNGIGAKTAIYTAIVATLTTVDAARGLRFTQVWRDGGDILEEPVIEKYTGAPYTEIKFMPNYAGIFHQPDGLSPLIRDLFYTRVVFASLYRNLIAPKATIRYNGVAVTTTADMVLRELYPDGRIHRIIVKPVNAPAHMHRPWEIYAVGVDRKPYIMSVVNGIVVGGGTHIKHIKDAMITHLRTVVKAELLDKSTTLTAEMLGKVAMIIISPIPNPLWSSQRKDKLEYNRTEFAPYAITPAHLRDLSADVATRVKDMILSRRQKKSKIVPDKYKPAQLAGTKRARETMLFCVEGDSAFAQAEVGIGRTSELTFERCGLYSLGGVIVNARKEVVIHDPARRIFNKSDKWQNNSRITGLIDVLGLNYSYAYEPSTPSFDKEMSTLRYGKLVGLVDQDYDGKGNILSLLMSMIEYFWPGLIRAGFIKWLSTPIIRVYPDRGGKVLSFHSVSAFEAWAADKTGFTVKYCKGLASNDDDETIHMFKAWAANLFTYEYCSRTHDTFEIYLGDDPSKRKKQLSLPGYKPSVEELNRRARTHVISCADHLLEEADAFQKDNLARKLDNYIDGLTKARRKVLDGCIDRYRAARNSRVKVVDLAASVTQAKQYEHGETSLEKTIKIMAATYIGGRQLPYLLPNGMFGTRTGGPKSAGSSRYIYAKFNWRLVDVLFPAEDYSLLKFTQNEGTRGEPEYFVPIIPTAILETIELPAHGWKLKKWARDALSVIDYARAMITKASGITRLQLPPFTHGWTGTMRHAGGKIWAVGKYTISGDVVTVTELPLTVWTSAWVASIRAKIEETVKLPNGTVRKIEREDPYILDIDETGNNGDIVCTRITMHPGAIAALEELDNEIFTGIERYLNIAKSQANHLNLMTEDMCVREFTSYVGILLAWYPHRKSLYAARMSRRRLLLTLRIELETAILKYIAEYPANNLSGATQNTMTQNVVSRGFIKLKPSILTGWQIMSDEKLVAEFHNGGFEYLFGLTDFKKSSESFAKRQAKLMQLHADLVAHDKKVAADIFPGAGEWLAELEALREVIIAGRATQWKFGDVDKYQL